MYFHHGSCPPNLPLTHPGFDCDSQHPIPNPTQSSAAIFKRHYDARAELLPALYSAYQRQGATGLPAVRHPVLDFDQGGDAARLGQVLDAYMFADLLVAPGQINATAREIYFPAASRGWVSFWDPSSSPTYAAGQAYNVSCPDDVLPVFQQVGSVVPLADLADGRVLRLRAVAAAGGGGEGATTLVYDDDGRTLDHRAGAFWQAAASVGALSASRARLLLEPRRTAWQPSWHSVRWEVAFVAGSRPRAGAAVAASCARAGAAVSAEASLSAEGLLLVSHAAPAAGEDAAAAGIECEVSFAS